MRWQAVAELRQSVELDVVKEQFFAKQASMWVCCRQIRNQQIFQQQNLYRQQVELQKRLTVRQWPLQARLRQR